MKLLVPLLLLPQTFAQTTTITPITSNYILAQSQTNLLTAQSGGLVTITSDIPVSISRYNDDRYADGEQPIFPTDAFVIVTSDCNAGTPTISWDYSTGGSVTINAGITSNTAAFLEPASYTAEWSWLNWACDVYPTPAPFSPSVFSLGPTEAGQAVTIKSQGETQTLDEYQGQQNANNNGGSESDDKPFNEEEYNSTSAAGRVSTALFGAVLLIVVMTGEQHRWVTIGKVGVAALSLSPLVSRFSSKYRTPKQTTVNPRSLQTCTYQAEILLDGCTHPLSISAPAVQVVDALVMNSNSQKGAEEPCLYEYGADITFPTSSVTTYDGGDVEIDALSYSECIRATDGRPFVDRKGGSLIAKPLVGEVCESCESCAEQSLNSNSSSVNEARVALGEEWIERALGEHASIASFSAFSIALMTNAAPSKLVEDALVAALDEVRHARTSFHIASKLVGREVSAGALPESKHEFGQDLTELGLAVAKEGCVDETLSAIAAAFESLELMNEGSKYAALDVSTATWIRSELNTIAMEEANHSALAWRTLFWVCSVDSEACDVVKKEVLDVKQLETRFNYRFAKIYEGRPEVLEEMNASWREVYKSLVASLDSEASTDRCAQLKVSEQKNILSELTSGILRGALCDAQGVTTSAAYFM
ncbi:hypothetical protein ACHAWO_013204 [Cyclotella atomus]|uniref:Uncharacterized protein n=1 Tax=Cyclotella atomus TaxID=382360 RepID=A0ABD3N7N0_9STRA